MAAVPATVRSKEIEGVRISPSTVGYSIGSTEETLVPSVDSSLGWLVVMSLAASAESAPTMPSMLAEEVTNALRYFPFTLRSPRILPFLWRESRVRCRRHERRASHSH